MLLIPAALYLGANQSHALRVNMLPQCSIQEKSHFKFEASILIWCAVYAKDTSKMPRRLWNVCTHVNLQLSVEWPHCILPVCKSCIFKFLHEDNTVCPQCNIDLGQTPRNLIRPDHALQCLVDKLFPGLEEVDTAKGKLVLLFQMR